MNKKVIVILNNSELLDLYCLNLNGFLNTEVVKFTKYEQVPRFLENDKKIDLIITVKEINKIQISAQLCEFLDREAINTPVIVLGSENVTLLKKAHKKLVIEPASQADDIRNVIKLSLKLLKITGQDITQVPTSKYYPIPLSHFYTLKETVCDIFIKIGHGEKYLKRVNKGDGLEEDDLKRYASFKTFYLFIESGDRFSFISDLTNMLIGKMEGSDEDEKIKSEQIAIETIQANVDDLANPEIVKVAKSSMKSMMKDSAVYPKFHRMLTAMLKNKGSFAYAHIKLISYFGLSILREMDWAKKEQEETFLFLSMFHDISLNSDDLIKINSKAELRDADLNETDKQKVENHALEAAGLIAQYPKAPMGVATLIKQHHGIMNGIGFSESFSGNLSPLVVIFIVAEYAADYVLKNQASSYNKDEVMSYLKEIFSTNRFKKMIDALEKVC